MNNDYLRHGKEYPTSVEAMVVWPTKCRGGGTSQQKMDDATDGVTSFTQLDRIVCKHCQAKGHYAWDCYKAIAQQKNEYRRVSDMFSDNSSVGSVDSSDSARSHGSSGSSSNGSASGVK